MTNRPRADEMLAFIRARRVTRQYSPKTVEDEDLHRIVKAGCFAPSAGNWRLHRFLIIRDPERVRLIRHVSPGMLGLPAALIVTCTDARKATAEGVGIGDANVWIDIGAAAQNMMLAAEALGLGSCPMAAFSIGATQTILDLPPYLIPNFMLQIGHKTDTREKQMPNRGPHDVQQLAHVYWEAVPLDS